MHARHQLKVDFLCRVQFSHWFLVDEAAFHMKDRKEIGSMHYSTRGYNCHV